ncbi:MAG TPA: DUF5681 domain-containing protein [Chitinophagaceae bacterium]|nr:DUF5681 domain-containing protein [Chitinophagaceae bacterium]
MANNENLKPFKPGQSGNPNGRAKSWVTLAKKIGYKKSEAADCARSLLSLSHDELIEHESDPDISVLEKIICKALMKDIKKGSLRNLNIVMDRIFGKPKQEVDMGLDTDITVTIKHISVDMPQMNSEKDIDFWYDYDPRTETQDAYKERKKLTGPEPPVTREQPKQLGPVQAQKAEPEIISLNKVQDEKKRGAYRFYDKTVGMFIDTSEGF